MSARASLIRLGFGLLLVSLACAGLLRAATPPTHPLLWDALEKSHTAAAGETVASFTFTVTNKSAGSVEILEIRPSCGCTVVKTPSVPWSLGSGESGSFTATVDFRGKHGQFSKTIQVSSSSGPQVLHVGVVIPDSADAARERNRQLSLADRQAVFRGECASCHVAPGIDKTGVGLFHAVCGICHSTEHRASMVPDLAAARDPRDAAYWRSWIEGGKMGTLMPAFAQKQGGPLTDAQIDSLVEFLVTRPRNDSGRD